MTYRRVGAVAVDRDGLESRPLGALFLTLLGLVLVATMVLFSLDPVEGFGTRLRIGFYGGIVLALLELLGDLVLAVEPQREPSHQDIISANNWPPSSQSSVLPPSSSFAPDGSGAGQI